MPQINAITTQHKRSIIALWRGRHMSRGVQTYYLDTDTQNQQIFLSIEIQPNVQKLSING